MTLQRPNPGHADTSFKRAVPSQTFVTGVEKSLVVMLMKLQLFIQALIILRNPIQIWKGLSELQRLAKAYTGGRGIKKLAKKDGKYRWDMYATPWPSKLFWKNIKGEFLSMKTGVENAHGLRNVLLSVTTKCPLRCEHCYEWDNLNKKEKMSTTDLEHAVLQIQSLGVAQIHLGGGEPMMRFDDITRIVPRHKEKSEFWIATSGFGFTPERAVALREAGITGVAISLDHVDPEKHNAFRVHENAFMNAKLAALSAAEAGLVVSLTLCATRSFVSQDNLEAFINLARDWGASFVQLLHPKAVGHYDQQDVLLRANEVEVLEQFAQKVNYNRAYQKHPIVIYHEQYMKSEGCFGAGSRYLYVDPMGDIHACPFCRQPAGNIMEGNVSDSVKALRSAGCPSSLCEGGYCLK